MSDYAAKSVVISLLRKHGFSAEEIPEVETQTPDIRCSDGVLEYLIEIKEKTLDGERGADLVKPSGYARRDPLARSNKVSGIIKKAASQLDTVADPGTIRLMWFFPTSPHDRFLYKQLRYSVYGIRIACIRLPDGSSDDRECYYVDYNDFFMQRGKIDGVVVGNLQILLLNDHSPRCDILRASKLAALALNVEDPHQIEKEGKAFYLRSDVDRADGEAVKRALGRQYGGEVTEMLNFVRYSAVIRGGE